MDMQTNPLARMAVGLTAWHRYFTIVLLAMLMSLSGCNDSGDDTNAGQEQSSELLINLTDAPGKFSTYTVDVLSLTLTTASGAIVETLPLNTRVDFAQYTDMTEFLTAASVPPARYVKASMRLDYQNAEIWATTSSNQDAVKVENFTDPDGNPISTLDVSVHLEKRNSLVIVPGVPASLTLDFNLDASNELVFDDMDVPALIIQPLLIADLHPDLPKIHRVRGPLLQVDTSNNRFKVAIHPFFHRLKTDDARFGRLPVLVDGETIYDINGERFQGQAGLEALAAMPEFTATVALGDFHPRIHRFTAKLVLAGSSVPGGELDVVSGNVTKREGTTLTVQGATLVRSDGTVIFNDSVTVEVSADTGVKRLFSMDDYTIDAISVGQRVRIFGTLQDYNVGLSPVMDATASDNRVFMGMTVLRGFALDSTGPMLVDLQSVNFRHVDLFDFSGTGIDPDHDADPANYEVDTGTLDTGTIATGAPVAVGGFVTPFAQAPLDFEAQAVMDLSAVPAVMVVNWDPAAALPFDSLADDGMILSLADTGVFHHVGRAGVRVDLLNVGSPVMIQPVTDGMGVYVMVHDGTASVYTDFSLYVAALQDWLDNGGKARAVSALGHYDDAGTTITAERILAKLE